MALRWEIDGTIIHHALVCDGGRMRILRGIILGMLGVFYGFLVFLMLL